jgi:hypothetical protein
VLTVRIKGGLFLFAIWAAVTVLFLLSYRSSALAEGAKAEDSSA